MAGLSSAVHTAVYTRLVGTETPALSAAAITAQNALKALLPTVTLGGGATKKNIWLGNKSKAVSYPAVTYRLRGGRNTGLVMMAPVMDDVLDVEIWENGGEANTITEVYEPLDKLLNYDRGVAPRLPLSSGKCFWTELLTDLFVGYDERINAYYGLVSYQLRLART